MCIGRSPDETLSIVLDALPTALSCELVYLSLPGPPVRDCAVWRGARLDDAELTALRESLRGPLDETQLRVVPRAGPRFCLEVDLPMGKARGRLVAGRGSPFDPETDRMLARSAANLVGATLESANVLDSAHRKDEFLAMLGHELRNPLAPILTAVELLGRKESVEREQQIIERNTRHLARLVDDLLDISRVTRGHVELRRERVTLAAVLERAVEIAGPLITRQRHALRVAPAGDVALEGDPVRLAQVFGNLLGNAAKFTPPGGHIDVDVETTGDRVRVCVRDDGRGISPDQLSRIFQPFVQADREEDAQHGGLGLGLAIVSNLVERHGGTIEARSEGPGRGASFTVELPIAAAPPAMIASVRPRAPKVRRGVRVLVVDDNEDIAELLSMALEREGFETAVAFDAHQALESWQRFAPQAGILDVGLPNIDGYELARRLRAEYGGTPTLIAATGYGRESDRRQAADAGFDCHFVKPVSVEDLVGVLDRRVSSPGS